MHSSLGGIFRRPRSITQVWGTGKRQGTKPEAQSGMSSFVAIKVLNLSSGIEIGARLTRKHTWMTVPTLFWIGGGAGYSCRLR